MNQRLNIVVAGAGAEPHIGHFSEDGENEQNVALFGKKLKLYCDQTV